jgi:hypothetical protein
VKITPAVREFVDRRIGEGHDVRVDELDVWGFGNTPAMADAWPGSSLPSPPLAHRRATTSSTIPPDPPASPSPRR